MINLIMDWFECSINIAEIQDKACVLIHITANCNCDLE